jgi:hypothetical protein
MRKSSKEALTYANDLGDLTEFIGHTYKNVASYLLSCGFEYLECCFKYRKVFNDRENNRSILIDLYDETTELKGRVEYMIVCNNIYKR